MLFVNLFMEFFKAYKEEGEEKYEMNFQCISKRYLKDRFIYELMVLLPWGLLGNGVGDQEIFRLLWAIKFVRI